MRPWNLLLIAVMMLTVLEMVTAAVFFAWALFAKDARLPVQCKTIGLFLCLSLCVCVSVLCVCVCVRVCVCVWGASVRELWQTVSLQSSSVYHV